MDHPILPQNAALLLEGGSLRGLYTAGALDTLMEENIYFPAVAGVSAGALNGVNYVARQPGRAASINLRYRHDPRYFGPRAAFNGGSVFGLRFMLYDVPREVPFDADTFYNGGQRMIAVATNVQTGKAAYFEKGKTEFDFMEACRASASLPLASTTVRLGQNTYLDGGCACPIPLQWALDALEEAGRVFVLRPAQPVDIGRFEGDMDKLLALYNRGRREMRERLAALRAYLEG